MEIKPSVNPLEYQLGVIIARFQVNELHKSHIELIDKVCENHKKVIVFLGIPIIDNTRKNPLDYASREAMLKEKYPNIVVLPLKDMRDDDDWSRSIDKMIPMPFGELSALLYGSRDSFIPSYKGKYKTVELITDTFYSGTDVRSRVSKEILASKDFRAGVIHANFARRAITYPTVDVVAVNDNGQILLCKKPNESLFRFIGGFVDRTDKGYEYAAKREFSEETGGCEIDDLKYVASAQIKDWRYEGEQDGITTTLFVGKFIFGNIQPSDDIETLNWVYPDKINADSIMPEHRELYVELKEYLKATPVNSKNI